jgi:hypothetical protein
MITWQEILHKYKESEIPAEHLANLKILHQKINEVRKAYGKPMSPTSVYRTMADHLRIYKELGITDQAKIPMKSKHLSGQAVDVSDPDGKLMEWCKANIALLEKVEIWCEEKDDKKRVHFQIVPPKSGKRFFLP